MPLPGHETVALSSVHVNDVADTLSEKPKLATAAYDGFVGPEEIVGAGGVVAPDAIASVQTRTLAPATSTPSMSAASGRLRLAVTMERRQRPADRSAADRDPVAGT